MTTSRYGVGRPYERNEVFDRVRRTSRWTATGAAAAVAVIIGVVAHQLPGRSGASGSPATGGSAGTGPPAATGVTGATGTTGSGSTGIGSTGAAPTPTPRPPVAVSGGTGR